MKWASGALLCLTFVMAVLFGAGAAMDPVAGSQAALAAPAPGQVIGRKVVYGTADNAKVVYKYVRIPRPLGRAMSAMALHEVVTPAPAPAAVPTPAAATATAAAAPAATTTVGATPAAAAPVTAAGTKPDKEAADKAAAEQAAAAKAAPQVVTPFGKRSTAGIDAFLTEQLHFSYVALVLVLMTATAVGLSLGAAYQSYSKVRTQTDRGVSRYKAFAML